ncbi:Bro-N domain-containing protein [Pseudomonas aeruginosa]|uniref:BRO-N domain-containing protein n=1 Tax=Pseudomonas aeruginosa TaxID=287 RepID=UPI0029538BB0|nr:Bro-N domain-containing protein [Pseudomonas aeruginosa]MDV8133047.1 Bro-N domain-containing protein [Pseudomonas aeruginosa]
MQAAQVIPFKFDALEVRTLLIDDQPWFCVADICRVLGYSNSRDALAKHCREKGVAKRDTLTTKGRQALTFINEGNLYRLIIKSRKEEAQRFESWVCDEVLPAIRKHGRYEDTSNKMATLVDELIGMTEVNVIKGLIRDKAKVIPIDRRRGFQLAMHNRLHTRFNVPRVELIPAAQFESACNFIASYALEGEWLPEEEKKPGTFVLDEYQAQFVHSLIHYTHWVCCRWDQGIGVAVKALNPKFHAKTWEFFRDLRVCAEVLESAAPELVAHFRSRGALRPHDCVAAGHPVGHPAD